MAKSDLRRFRAAAEEEAALACRARAGRAAAMLDAVRAPAGAGEEQSSLEGAARAAAEERAGARRAAARTALLVTAGS